MNRRDEMDTQRLCSILVTEKDTAEREFFNHFGDDSSWPPGWWARLTEGKFTRLSWKRENYAPVRTWQQTVNRLLLDLP